MYKAELASVFIEPVKLSKDIHGFYLSKYLLKEVRDYFTVKEQEIFYQRKREAKSRTHCKKDWPICYLALELTKNKVDRNCHLFKSKYVLSNFKFDHFFQKRFKGLNTKKLPSEGEPKNPEDSILIERERHICSVRDAQYDEMVSDLRLRASKLISISTSLNASSNEAEDNTFMRDKYGEISGSFNKTHRKTRLQAESMGSKSLSFSGKFAVADIDPLQHEGSRLLASLRKRV